MKSKLLFIFTLLSFIGYGQLNFSSDSLYKEFNVNTAQDDIVIYHVFTPTTVPVDVKWEIFSVSTPSGWTNDAFVCDAITCYDETTDENQYTITENKSSALDVHYLNQGNAGVGTVKLLIYEVADSMNTFKIITYTVNVQEGVAIKDLSSSNFKLYPNPVKDVLYFDQGQIGEVDKIELFNVIGKKVYSGNVSNEVTSINLSEVERGIYIAKIYSNNSGLVHTQSFVKK